MDGEKETAEDKEEEEEEGLHLAAASSVEDQDLPIMHWEDLSQRIAELEKQEQERRERSKKRTRVRTDDSAVGLWRDVWEEEEEEEEEEEDDFRRCCVSVVASRFHQHRNLQLCFINDGDSEDEDGDNKKVSMVTGRNSCHASGLKQEVVTALRNRRDELLSEQKEEECLSSSCVAKRKHLERWELQERREQQLNNMRATLQQEVHALSSELVSQLLVRDQLRTKQDAMLLDVQDMT